MEGIMTDGLRIWFLVLQAIGIVVLLIKFIPARLGEKVFEKRIVDSRRLLPMICLPVDWLVPPLILLSGIGQLSAGWPFIRILGFALSLCAFFILAWVLRVLGRFLVSPAAVFADHVLVTSRPFGSSVIQVSRVPWLYGLARRWVRSTGFYLCFGFC